jgi:hypothetical protein
MTKKERKKLNRVKAIRKMKNVNSIKKINPFKNVFDRMFVENDFLNAAKLHCNLELDSAMLLNDLERIKYLHSARSDLETASIEVKDNVAIINFGEESPMIISYDKNSMKVDEGNGSVYKLAA